MGTYKTAASFRLTGRGHAIAAELRAHRAATRNSHQFMPKEAGEKEANG